MIIVIFTYKARQMAIGAVITFANGNPLVQFSFVFYSSLLVIALIGVIWPYSSNFDNRLELANEFTILIVLTWLTCQTDFMINTRGKTFAGWVLINIVLLLIIVNFGILMVFNLKTIWKKIRLCNLKRKRAKELRKKTLAEKIRKEAIQNFEADQLKETPQNIPIA